MSLELREVVAALLTDPRKYSYRMGGLIFYGATEEFEGTMQFVTDFIAEVCACSSNTSDRYPHSAKLPAGCRRAMFLGETQGKTTLAKAVSNELRAKGVAAAYLEGKPSSNWDKDMGNGLAALVIDDLPRPLKERNKALTRLQKYGGHVLLLTSPMYKYTEGLSVFNHCDLSNIDARPIDKACLLIGMLSERIQQDTNPMVSQIEKAVLSLLPAEAFNMICQYHWYGKLADLEDLIDYIAERIEVRLAPIPNESVQYEGLLTLDDIQPFMFRWLNDNAHGDTYSHRIVVEGDTDRDLLELGARLGQAAYSFDFLAGLQIVPLGSGRDGGTSRLGRFLITARPILERDIFLFDNDDDGRKAKDNLLALDKQFQVEILPDEFSRRPSGGRIEIEIEDLLSLECLDRFYAECSNTSNEPRPVPELEVLYYKGGPIRRLVISGHDKQVLADWLRTHAQLPDIERVLFMLCILRQRVGLKLHLATKEFETWKKQLTTATHPSSSNGARSQPWWPPSKE